MQSSGLPVCSAHLDFANVSLRVPAACGETLAFLSGAGRALHRISRDQAHQADRSTLFVCCRVCQEQGNAASRIDHHEKRINETFRLAWRRV